MSAETVRPANPNSGLALLLEFPFKADAIQLLTAGLQRLVAELPLPAPVLTAWTANSAAIATCYIDGAGDRELAAKVDDIATAAKDQLAAVIAGEIELSRLQNVAVHTGASAAASAGFHYVVRTDVATGGDAELQRWYDEEHMAMLAAVPGTVQARRFISLDAGPRYYACYDLVAPTVLTSAEWLRVRQTPWSQRVRPTFRNTRRVVSSKLELSNPASNP